MISHLRVSSNESNTLPRIYLSTAKSAQLSPAFTTTTLANPFHDTHLLKQTSQNKDTD